MSSVGRAFVLGCAIATAACAGEGEAEDSGTGALATGPIAPGVEQQRAGAADGSVASVQQRSVHFGNAHTLALLSDAAYASDNSPASLAGRGVPGVTAVTAFDNHCTGGYAILVESPSFAALAFRGTETDSREDVMADANDAFVDHPFERDGDRAQVHSGFRFQFASLWSANQACGVTQGIRERLVARRARTPLYLTGHSLGGALATLAVAELFVDGSPVAPLVPVAGVYTFGSPKVGNEAFAEVLGDDLRDSKTPFYRFVHKNDLVTVQPRPITSMIHGTWKHVQPSGESEHALQVWFDDGHAKIGSFALYVGISVKDHLLAGYIADIASNARARGELR